MNLFLATRSYAAGHLEDHLTDFVAAALQACPSFAADYIEKTVAKYAAEKGWGRVRIRSVDTQGSFPCGVPDLHLELTDESGSRRLVVAEHKLQASETVRKATGAPVVVLGETVENDEPQLQLQLARYLAEPAIDGVLYVREWWKTPAAAVMEHPKYIRPAWGAEHFLWRDFYPLLVAHDESNLLVHWLREGFERISDYYTPPNPIVGDLDDPDPDIRSQNRRSLQQQWDKTRVALRERGWSMIEANIHGELYAYGNPASIARMIFVNPHHHGQLLFRVAPRDDTAVDSIRARITTALQDLPWPSEAAQPPPVVEVFMNGTQGDVQFTTSLSSVLGDDPSSVGDALVAFIDLLVEAIDSPARLGSVWPA